MSRAPLNNACLHKPISAIQQSLYFLSLSCLLSPAFLRPLAPSLARSTWLACFLALAVFSRCLSDIFLRSLTVAHARTVSLFVSLAHSLARMLTPSLTARMLTRSLTRFLRHSLFFGVRAPSVAVSHSKRERERERECGCLSQQEREREREREWVSLTARKGGVSHSKALWNDRHISGRISGGRPSALDAIVAKVSFFTRKGKVDGAVGSVLAT